MEEVVGKLASIMSSRAVRSNVTVSVDGLDPDVAKWIYFYFYVFVQISGSW